MLLVETRLQISPVHGLGLFAAQFLYRDSLIWRFQQGFDLALTLEEIASLSEEAQRQLFHYSYFEPNRDVFILCSDDARFMNHADTPNCLDYISSDGQLAMKALRDIRPGEELTCDYRIFGEDLDFQAQPGSWIEGLYAMRQAALKASLLDERRLK